MEYIINLIQSHLNEELRQLEVAKDVTAGKGMLFSKETMAAFDESKRLAEERIPQLKLALEMLSKKAQLDSPLNDKDSETGLILSKIKDGHYELSYLGEIIGSTYPYENHYLLSVENCQAIERGYDLDELALHSVNFSDYENESEYKKALSNYKKCVQKALDLMGDKKFNLNDMLKAFEKGAFYGSTKLGNTHYFDELINSIIKKEWAVDLRQKHIGKVKLGVGSKTEQLMPEKDSKGCIILTLM